MSTSRVLLIVPHICLFVLLAQADPVAAQGAQPAAGVASVSAPLSAAFTFQGSLRTAGVPADGLFDFQFTLHDADEGGSPVGAAQEIGDVFVENGIFTVELDFGPDPFQGEARWLQVAVRPGASTDPYTVLSPRQLLTAVPYARFANRATWAGLSGVPAGFADEVDDDTHYSAGAGLILTDTTFAADSTYLQRRLAGSCSAGSALRAVDEEGRVVCESFWSLAGNAGTTPGTDFVGTTDNVALEFRVNDQRVLRLEPSGDTPNVIGGSISNTVTSGKWGATIAGGGRKYANCGDGDDPCYNSVTERAGTVGGGYGNTAGFHATVGGGSYNTASGGAATIPGGSGNVASGNGSFAAGTNAVAAGDGSFVWADTSTTAAYEGIDQPDTFSVRATGGSRFDATGWGALHVVNYDDTPADNIDAITAEANVSRGANYPAVWAENFGTGPAVHARTAGTYSGYFMQDIYVAGACTGCTLAYLAVNTGSKTLQVGEVVAADGVAAPLNAGGRPVLAVRRADGRAVGVVAGRAALAKSTREGETTVGAEKTAGPVAPGDHLFIIVYGMAQVRGDATAAAIAAGQRLTASNRSGAARALRTVPVEGVEVAEAAPTIGTALEALPRGEALIWVLVNVR